MTYFGILAIFLLPPLVALLIFVPKDLWRRWVQGRGQVEWTVYRVIGIHVALALIYTTPWDNYLVATGVWWYDPELVTGLRLGYVPIEEYTFFILQTLLTSLWVVGLKRFFISPPQLIKPNPALRRWTSGLIILAWTASTAVLLSGWKPGAYLTLILSWGLFPILIQFIFGADILAAHIRLLFPAVLVPTLYLWIADAVALSAGTWTIDPLQTTGIRVGILPLEEMIFFLMTNLIISFGITLMLSPVSQARAVTILEQIKRKWRRSANEQMVPK